MKIIADLRENIVSKIREQVAKGNYSSISDFLAVAAENQISLESLDSDAVLNFGSRNNIVSERIDVVNVNVGIPSGDIPVLDLIPKIIPENIWDLWIWGQINRILPFKFGARMLAIKSAEDSHFPEKDSFNEFASIEARRVGLFLKEQDLKMQNPRDSKLSTAFPTGAKEESSLDRYWSQFIGYQRNNGSSTGALFDLGFAELINDENGILRIGLTSEGRKFALLPNSVLDFQKFETSLDNAEIDFYLDHITSQAPGEVSLFCVLLGLLDRGVVRREELNLELEKYVDGSGWSKGLVSTQRSGAMSRMFELGLLDKKRSGLEIRYGITEKGSEFLVRNSK